MARSLPNIIITGTPGTGKTTHCEVLAEKTGLKHLSVNQVVKEKECHEGWDDEYQSWVVDEDKVSFLPNHPHPPPLFYVHTRAHILTHFGMRAVSVCTGHRWRADISS